MEVIITFLAIFAVFLYVMIRNSIEEKNRYKAYRNDMQKLYGSCMDKEYSEENMEKISRYYMHLKCDNESLSNEIDDITWNDLSMDDIYANINYCQSSSGEEYLYAMLRRPLLDDEQKFHEALDRHINYMDKHENEKLDTIMALYRLGKSGRFSIFDYFDYIDELGSRKNTKHYIAIVLLIAAIVMIFVNVSVGVGALILVVCFNIVVYFKEKGVAQPYVTSFSYIIRMIKTAENIIKCNTQSDNEDISGYISDLKIKRNNLKDFEKNSAIVLKMNSSVGSFDEILFDYIKMVTHLDLIQFNKMLNIIQKNRREIEDLVVSIGYIDTVISIAYFRKALPHYCVPTLIKAQNDNTIVLNIADGYHPLIKSPVTNSFNQKKGMLITGSNASGKSTFLKMTAINALLAQTIYTCAAKEYQGNYFKIYSSMSLRDNLAGGESYYIVEIKALKRIADIADEASENPLLCFVDEVLRGTNTVERIAASTQILDRLSQKNILCFAATHDIELTHLLENKYDNYHFEEEVKDGDMLFSYHLLNGRAHTRNAIRLLEIMGYSEEIIKKADLMAQNFLKNGEWK